jgi:hypothetical protein
MSQREKHESKEYPGGGWLKSNKTRDVDTLTEFKESRLKNKGTYLETQRSKPWTMITLTPWNRSLAQ